MTATAQPGELTAEAVRAGMVRLPAHVKTRAQAAQFLQLPTQETEDVNLPYSLLAITYTVVPEFPFALVLRVPRDYLRKSWPPYFCPATRICAIRRRGEKVTGIESIY